MPHYFYIYNISSHDFDAIQTPRAEIHIFTTGTPYKISSRALLPPSLRTGIFTVECACPEPFRWAMGIFPAGERRIEGSCSCAPCMRGKAIETRQPRGVKRVRNATSAVSPDLGILTRILLLCEKAICECD